MVFSGGNGGTGADIPVPLTRWQRVPIGSRGRGRQWYNVDTHEYISDYRYRQLRRELTTEQFREAQALALADRQRYYLDHNSLVLTYQARMASEGKYRSVDQIVRDRTFLRHVRELEYYTYINRRSLTDPNRERIQRADGPLAETLVALGRRLPSDEWEPGTSPRGHIDATVMPYLIETRATGG